MGNKYDVICLFTGVFTSTFFIDTVEKILSTCTAMLIATTMSFFFRRFLWFKFKDMFKNKIKNKDGTLE